MSATPKENTNTTMPATPKESTNAGAENCKGGSGGAVSQGKTQGTKRRHEEVADDDADVEDQGLQLARASTPSHL